MQLAEVTPKPGVVDPRVTTVSAKIPNFQNLDPRSVGMALLSLGSAVPYSYDARNGAVSIAVRDGISAIQSKVHRAIVWGTDVKTGKRVEATWVFRLPDPNKPPAPAAQPPLPVVKARTPAAPARVVAASVLGGTPVQAGGGSPKR
jgi:hypothetical protein